MLSVQNKIPMNRLRSRVKALLNVKYIGLDKLTGLIGFDLLISTPSIASGDLVIVPEWPKLVTLLIVFVALIIPTNKFLFQPIFKVLDEREERIQGARERATRIQQEAKEVLARYKSSVRDAEDEAEQGRKGMIGIARSEQASVIQEQRGVAEQELTRVREEIQSLLTAAHNELRSGAESLAREAAEQVLGRPLS